jgi:glutamate dehydrogenase (NADP+)
MENIHQTCVENGTEPDGYVKGTNIGGFLKVTSAMRDQGLE